jgi:hypothetical protein
MTIQNPMDDGRNIYADNSFQLIFKPSKIILARRYDRDKVTGGGNITGDK